MFLLHQNEDLHQLYITNNILQGRTAPKSQKTKRSLITEGNTEIQKEKKGGRGHQSGESEEIQLNIN